MVLILIREKASFTQSKICDDLPTKQHVQLIEVSSLVSKYHFKCFNFMKINLNEISN